MKWDSNKKNRIISSPEILNIDYVVKPRKKSKHLYDIKEECGMGSFETLVLTRLSYWLKKNEK